MEKDRACTCHVLGHILSVYCIISTCDLISFFPVAPQAGLNTVQVGSKGSAPHE